MVQGNGIHFVRVEKEAPWRDFLKTHFALQSERLEELLNFGAIYRNHKRWAPRADEILQVGDVMRVHKQPRRFAIERQTSACVRAVEKNWALVWKHSGVPSHETLDNLRENAKAWLERERGEKLWSLNRLDVGTRGWLLLARNAAFARAFNIEMQSGRVRKFYECLSAEPEATVGPWRHWMKKSDRAPKELSALEDSDHTLRCELRTEWRSFLDRDRVHSRVQLLTGRTHQIRAQFAFAGAPLLGDALYGSEFPSRSQHVDEFALSCEAFTFEDEGRRWSFERLHEAPTLPDLWSPTFQNLR